MVSDIEKDRLEKIALIEECYQSDIVRKAIKEYIDSYYYVTTLIEP